VKGLPHSHRVAIPWRECAVHAQGCPDGSVWVWVAALPVGEVELRSAEKVREEEEERDPQGVWRAPWGRFGGPEQAAAAVDSLGFLHMPIASATRQQTHVVTERNGAGRGTYDSCRELVRPALVLCDFVEEHLLHGSPPRLLCGWRAEEGIRRPLLPSFKEDVFASA